MDEYTMTEQTRKKVTELLSDNPVLRFKPNIRHEAFDAKQGYIWGKPARESNILKALGFIEQRNGKNSLNKKGLAALGIKEKDIVAELWIASDDRQYPSMAILSGDEDVSFSSLIEEFGEQILGEKHIKQYGPYLTTIMKFIDTNGMANKGSLSVQVHPKVAHPTRPAKPEMWRGKGKVFLGWKQDVSEEDLKNALSTGDMEKYLNAYTIDESDLVVVPGGTMHAIRYGSFLAEWSKAPGEDDVKKGSIKDATIGLFDRTDGKKPRPGKEDLDGALDVLRHAHGFKSEVEFFSSPRKQFNDGAGNTIYMIFQTPEVIVDEIVVTKGIDLSLKEAGVPLYVQEGTIEIRKGNRILDTLKAGEYCFLPTCLNAVELVAIGGRAVMQRWHPPYSRSDEIDFDAPNLDYLRRRLGDTHLSIRLRRQSEYVALEFGEKGWKFYWAHMEWLPPTVKLVLKLTGLLKRGMKNAMNYRVIEKKIKFNNLPEEFKGLRVLQLTDLHLEGIPDGGEKLIETLKNIECDLCVIVGDFRFDTTGDYSAALHKTKRIVDVIQCPEGIIGTLGNHDFIEMVPGLEAMGIHMLLNESLVIERKGKKLGFAGTDDVWFYEAGNLEKAIEGTNDCDFKILLAHSQDLIKKAATLGVDYYLCGHTHGGQICLPGGIPLLRGTSYRGSYVGGPWEYEQMKGHTSRGVGASGVPVRFNCPPEIIIHEFI